MLRFNSTTFSVIGFLLLFNSVVLFKGTLQYVGFGLAILFLVLALVKRVDRK